MKVKEKIIDILSAYNDEMENASEYLHENDDLSKLGMNSLSFIKMVVALEGEFNFEFDDEALDYNKFTSLNSLCDYVKEQMMLNNVTYNENGIDNEQSIIKKEVINILSQHSNDKMINQPTFNEFADLNLCQAQIENILNDVQERFGIKLDINIIEQENIITLSGLCSYICDNA